MSPGHFIPAPEALFIIVFVMHASRNEHIHIPMSMQMLPSLQRYLADAPASPISPYLSGMHWVMVFAWSPNAAFLAKVAVDSKRLMTCMLE